MNFAQVVDALPWTGGGKYFVVDLTTGVKRLVLAPEAAFVIGDLVEYDTPVGGQSLVKRCVDADLPEGCAPLLPRIEAKRLVMRSPCQAMMTFS